MGMREAKMRTYEKNVCVFFRLPLLVLLNSKQRFILVVIARMLNFQTIFKGSMMCCRLRSRTYAYTVNALKISFNQTVFFFYQLMHLVLDHTRKLL